MIKGLMIVGRSSWYNCISHCYNSKMYKQPAEMFYKRDSNKCFPVNSANFLRKPIFNNICDRQLLKNRRVARWLLLTDEFFCSFWHVVMYQYASLFYSCIFPMLWRIANPSIRFIKDTWQSMNQNMFLKFFLKYSSTIAIISKSTLLNICEKSLHMGF